MKLDKHLNIYYDEKDNGDKVAVKECKDNYKYIDFKDKVVLDLGANIGGFTKLALDNGCKKVIAVECLKRNFDMLKYNCSDDRSFLLYGAVSNEQSETVDVYKSNSKRSNISVKTSDSITNRNSTYENVEKVTAYNLYSLLDQYKPDILKIDVEGAEFFIFDEDKKINESVKEMFLEIHLTSKRRFNQLIHVIEQFDEHIFNHSTWGAKENCSVTGYDCRFKR